MTARYHPDSARNANFDPNFCDLMVQFRARNRMTQAELADMTGLSLATIINAETGRRGPSKTTRIRILDCMAAHGK